MAKSKIKINDMGVSGECKKYLFSFFSSRDGFTQAWLASKTHGPMRFIPIIAKVKSNCHSHDCFEE